MEDLDPDDPLAGLASPVFRRLVLRAARSIVLAAVAFWLSVGQIYVDYSDWRLSLLVLVIASMGRFQWIAGALVLWLLALYVAPPELVAAMKAAMG
ncbi:hypothetical protein LJR090_002567 [Bosea sp. LjRoot90]|uniref:hypothetical protein n=1 Tax=Bosea sp. LjRoot90 TaxID=3342342 RepID=UPI003ECFCC71